MSQKKRIYVRPKNPEDAKAEGNLLSGLVAWGMACKADYDARQRAKRVSQGGLSAPPVVYPAAAPPSPPAPKPIVVEEQAKPAPPQPKPQVVAPPRKIAPPPSKFNSALTLKECYNSKLDQREEIIEVDETSEDLLKELARGFIRSTKKR